MEPNPLDQWLPSNDWDPVRCPLLAILASSSALSWYPHGGLARLSNRRDFGVDAIDTHRTRYASFTEAVGSLDQSWTHLSYTCTHVNSCSKCCFTDSSGCVGGRGKAVANSLGGLEGAQKSVGTSEDMRGSDVVQEKAAGGQEEIEEAMRNELWAASGAPPTRDEATPTLVTLPSYWIVPKRRPLPSID